MQDRPTHHELLAALVRFLDEAVVAESTGARRFHARVATNALRILQRQLEREYEDLVREWAGLDALLGPAERPTDPDALRGALAARNEDLCARIRRGDADEGPFRQAVLTHVRETVRAKLLVNNPSWLEGLAAAD